MHIPHLRPHPHIPFFRIFYSTTFTILSLVLGALLLVTPGDHIRESFNQGQLFHVFIVAGLYLLTLLVSVFVYAGRLFATRSALARIPKEVDWSEETGRVGREIRRGLERSAVVAYASRPRDLRDERRMHRERKGEREKKKKKKKKMVEEEQEAGRPSLDSIAAWEPVWGVIAHPGWSSPSSPDLPNVQYEPVIRELSHLIEAKAVSLAPSDPLLASAADYDPDRHRDDTEEGAEAEAEAEAPIPDPVAVDLLRRPASMCLRDYLSHLAAVGMLDLDPTASDFLTRYEYARYSGHELDEGQFRTLMGVFADVLRGMRPLDVAVVDEVRAEMMMAAAEEDTRSDNERDNESVITTETVHHTPRPDTYPPSSSSSSSPPSSPTTIATPTAPSSPRSGTLHTAPSQPPATTTSRVRRPAAAATMVQDHSVHGRNMTSNSSLRRVRTDRSSGGYSARSSLSSSAAGSVIRLREARGPLDLPYVILTGDDGAGAGERGER